MYSCRSKCSICPIETEVDRYGREIFGPVLPVIPVKSIDDAIAFINERCVSLTPASSRILIDSS